MELLSGISPKLLPTELAPGVVRSIALIALGTVLIGVAVPDGVPPTVPATVWPLLVPVGWVGSVTV